MKKTALAHNLDKKTRTKDVLLEDNVTFDSLLLSANVKNGLKDCGFKKPSPIQFKAVPLGRCGFDLIVKSKSGTGKTLVFSTVALETVNVNKEHLQVLILVPTREIAVQIQSVLKSIGSCIEGLNVESFIGGLPLEEDIQKAKKCHIAVGAPGRVKHLITIKSLSTKSIKLFVLDEADKLMESTFKSDIDEIYNNLPPRKQLIVTSATYPKELDNFLAKYMLSPTHVTSENETPLLLGLKQFVSVLKATTINAVQQMKAKNEMLLEIFSKISFTQCLVFTNYQSKTESVCNFLNQNGWNSSFISAAVDQTSRLEAINNLKSFKSRILLSTDLTSRGIDAPNVDLVINYDLPHDAVTYLHRMGRAGRYGSSGICINFALEGAEVRKLQLILGTIGASNISVAKLPLLNAADLWQLDPNDLEQIWGIVPDETSNEIRENIKEEVLSIKQHKNKENKGKQKNGKKKVKLEELGNSDCVQSLLKRKEEEREKEVSDVDVEALLTSLKSDDNEDLKKRKRCDKAIKNEDNSKVEDAVDLLVTLLNNEDSKKLKLDALVEQKSQKERTFCKNVALLSITKVLCDYNTQIDASLVNSVEEYLTVLKESNFEAVDGPTTVEEVLTNDFTLKTEEIMLKNDNFDDVENIFRVGYECAVKNNGKTWLNCLPAAELQKFQEFCQKECLEEEDCEMEDYEEEEYEEQEEEEYEEQEVEQSTEDNILQWVPVERQSSEDHFSQCYEDCSTILWQTGLTFETVEDFDNWFYLWQDQLQSVRNYVQQNIYVDEMSKYQQNRVTNK